MNPDAADPYRRPGGPTSITPTAPIPARTRHSLAETVTVDSDVRCWRCARLLIEMAGRPWRVKCGRCKATNESPDAESPPAG